MYAPEDFFSTRVFIMPKLPAELLPLIVTFQPLFAKSVWENAQTLLVGAILAIGKRTVTACLRVMGKSDDEHFQNYHRVLICTPLLQPHLEFSDVKDFDRLRQRAVSQERDRQPEEIDRWQ
jgi:hypothetical protein